MNTKKDSNSIVLAEYANLMHKSMPKTRHLDLKWKVFFLQELCRHLQAENRLWLDDNCHPDSIHHKHWFGHSTEQCFCGKMTNNANSCSPIWGFGSEMRFSYCDKMTHNDIILEFKQKETDTHVSHVSCNSEHQWFCRKKYQSYKCGCQHTHQHHTSFF